VASGADGGPLYLDASALVRLVVREPESEDLIATVERCPLVSSELLVAEVPRAVRTLVAARDDVDVVDLIARADAELARVALVPVTRQVLTVAGALAGGGVRTVDALHVASALLVEDVSLLVSYDARQLRAAAEAGLAIASPGRA
jgi:predicted nucleic acid-binding protein